MGDPWALHRLQGRPIPPGGVDPFLAADLMAFSVLEEYPHLLDHKPEPPSITVEAQGKVDALLGRMATAVKGGAKQIDLREI